MWFSCMVIHFQEIYFNPKMTKQWLTHLNPSTVTYYTQPLHIVRGRMQYLWDSQGRKYLDMIGGIVTVSVGHCHPYVLSL